MIPIVVWPDATPMGWDGNPQGLDKWGRPVPWHPCLTLEATLSSTWPTDAHFVPYHVPGYATLPRLRKQALGPLKAAGIPVLFGAVVADLDDEAVHKGTVPEALPEWRRARCEAMATLPPEMLASMGWYETRGGYRLLWTLPTFLEADAFQRLHVRFLAFLADHGLKPDPLTDWTRCYRLPRVVRDGVAQNRPMDVSRLAVPLSAARVADLSVRALPADPRGPLAGLDTPGPRPIADRITENRNVALTSIAGRLRGTGMDAAEIGAALGAINASRCDPPLDAAEVIKIAESVGSYEAPPMAGTADPKAPKVIAAAPLIPSDARFALGSEVEFADEAARVLEEGRAVPLIADLGEVWRYYPGRGLWEPLRPETIAGVVHGFDGEWILTGTNPDGSPKVARLKVSRRLCDDVAKVLAARRASIGFFDGAPAGLTFANGFVTVDARGVTVVPFDPRQRSAAGLPFEYRPGAVPARFVAMLRECFHGAADTDARIALLREFVGCALCGRATTYQRGLVLVGEGANGKSTFLEIVGALFADRLKVAIPPQRMGHGPSRADLAGARLNMVSELPEADILDSTAIKAIVDGSLITGERKYKDPFVFRPVAGHMFAANDLPAVRDLTRAFWRRWLVVEWPREFAEAEQDRRLAVTVIASELSDLASWAVEGLADLERRGEYVVPPSSRAALDAWREGSDPVARFVAETCVPDPQGQGIGAAELYQSFGRWAVLNGHKEMTSAKFGKRIAKSGIVKTRNNAGFRYGLKMRPFSGNGQIVNELTISPSPLSQPYTA